MANQQRFEQLKQKYQPAIDQMKQLNVHLTHVNMDGDKLYVSGDAPSQEAKNKAWDHIKAIDLTYSDLICDLKIDTSLQQPSTQQQAPSQQSSQSRPQTMTAGATTTGGQGQRHYTVQPGDSLSKISKQFYGNANDYMKIFEANRGVLKDPNQIRPGQELTIPE